MDKPSPTDRAAVTGSEHLSGEPDIAVFDESVPTQLPGPKAADSTGHDLYRRPVTPPAAEPAAGTSSGEPVAWSAFDDTDAAGWPAMLTGADAEGPDRSTGSGPTAHSEPVPEALPSISDFWPETARPSAAEAAGYESPAPAEPQRGDESSAGLPERSFALPDAYVTDPYATDHDVTDPHPTAQYVTEPYSAADAHFTPEPNARRIHTTRRQDGQSSLNDLLDPRAEHDDELPLPVTAAPDTGSAPGLSPDRRARRRVGARIALLVALVLLVGTGITLAVLSPRSDVQQAGAVADASGEGGSDAAAPTGAVPRPVDTAPPVTGPNTANAISAPLNGRTEAGFDLVNGTSTVNLHTASLGEELYRISTPQDSDVVPQATETGDRIQLFLARSGKSGAGAVDIVLNSDVRWDLRVTGGVDRSVIDMSDSKVNAVDLAGGATRIDLTLPRPDGTLKVRMTGGVNQFLVYTADSVPVRVRVGSGAGQVKLDGRTHNGIAPGALFTPPQWAQGGDRIDLDAVAGMATLTVGQR